MDASSSNSNTISELQQEAINTRKLSRVVVSTYVKKINKMKIKSLENTSFTTDHETFDIPDFNIEKYEQIDVKNYEEKLKDQLKDDIIVMRTLIRKRSCSITELLEKVK